MNVARALFYQAHIPSIYWSECVSTATFLINRTPSRSLNNISPYAKLYKEEPSYFHLRTFGCLAFASTLPSKRQKFDPRATSCVFVGYPQGMKAYRLLDIETKQIFVSRDVIFHEEIFPFKISQSNPHINPFISHTLPEPIVVESIPEPIHIEPSQIILQQTNPHDDYDQDEVVFQENVTQRPQRQRTKPTYLGDYHCNLVNFVPNKKLPKYPLSDVLSYSQLSPSYQAYVYAISTQVEPTSFKEAIESPEWKLAMDEELQALVKLVKVHVSSHGAS